MRFIQDSVLFFETECESCFIVSETEYEFRFTS